MKYKRETVHLEFGLQEVVDALSSVRSAGTEQEEKKISIKPFLLVAAEQHRIC